ncbi:MAG: hypothetical protein COW65_06480 [Cytophagales bacterium CG18_big_fil_WC_8_21_14_2_50_42_9]|nr:MAG: hypothetical protein COW65_06480 [Cytophagales bacterium CG18_big_fil_WC_8_21_14_2_50_42_9]
MTSDPALLIQLENVFFAKLNFSGFNNPDNQNSGFENINWEVKPGETWVITGPVGAGKTTLAEAIMGKHRLQKGKISIYDPSDPENKRFLPRHKIAFLSFQPHSAQLNYNNFYLQQRYNSSESEDAITMQEFLAAALPAAADPEKITETARLLGILDLLHLQVIKLSNGQTRKMLLARALLQEPLLLILDNPYAGLDVQTRQDLNKLLQNLIDQHIHIILLTNQNEVPEFATHVLLLDNSRVKGHYTREAYIAQEKTNWPEQNANELQPILDYFQKNHQPAAFDICVRFENTNINYDSKQVLQNINWTVKRGEKWALSGPNGSGKTTLLSLINGDNPQAFANKITLFDKRKGSGESIWDLKKRIGFMSPELHLYFRRNITSEAVAATGFADTLYLNRNLSASEENLVALFFSYYNLESLRQKSFLELSTGQQRLVLLIRSLLKNPDLLIWDEPFQGLSNTLMAQSLELLKTYATPNKTIIFVSHYNTEIPAWIDKKMQLENGKIKSIVC